MTADSASRSSPASPTRVVSLTGAALLAFALNSLLCRAALGNRLIDPQTFTLVRLGSGAAALWLLSRISGEARTSGVGRTLFRFLSPISLFVYALGFSLAYTNLSAGTGAFVVFCCVQVTMIGSDLLRGFGLRGREIAGLALALSGLAWLTRPGAESPDLRAVGLMALAGLAWGVYSLRGRTSGPPLLATSANFMAATPLALLASLASMPSFRVTSQGLALAAISGAITSGLGYVAWYAALPSLTATRASILQLAVPPLAAAMGVFLLGETLSPRLRVAAPLILGGIALAISNRGRARD